MIVRVMYVSEGLQQDLASRRHLSAARAEEVLTMLLAAATEERVRVPAFFLRTLLREHQALRRRIRRALMELKT